VKPCRGEAREIPANHVPEIGSQDPKTERYSSFPLQTKGWHSCRPNALRSSAVFQHIAGFLGAFVRPRDMSAWLLTGVLLASVTFSPLTPKAGAGHPRFAEFLSFLLQSGLAAVHAVFRVVFPATVSPDRAQTLSELAKFFWPPS